MALFLWMTGALASFCILAIGARELSGELSIAQSLAIRSAIGLVFLSGVYFIRSRFFKDKRLKSIANQPRHKMVKLHFFVMFFIFLLSTAGFLVLSYYHWQKCSR